MMLWMVAMAALAASEAPLDVHDPARPVALGTRLGAWTGPYEAPALGGQIKLRPSESVGLTGFADHTLAFDDGFARHDHVIGFSVWSPALLGGPAAYVSPTLGACVDFRADSPVAGQRMPTQTDVLFGAHVGLTGEVALAPRVSAEANAQGFAYVGNRTELAGWAASSSPGLHGSWVMQLVAGLNVTL